MVPKDRFFLYFQDYNEKIEVLRNAKKLKGSKVFINNDYSQATLMKRKMLWESARHDKNEGTRVYLINDKLHVNYDIFVRDENKNARVSIST